MNQSLHLEYLCTLAPTNRGVFLKLPLVLSPAGIAAFEAHIQQAENLGRHAHSRFHGAIVERQLRAAGP